MMTQVLNWRSCFFALILCGLAVCTNMDEDSMVRSSDQSGPGPSIRVGVTGRVTTSDNFAVKGALVQPRSLDDPSPPIPEIAILSDDSGRYVWSLLPGRYEISVTARGCGPVAKQVVVEEGQVAQLDFTLQCESQRVKP